MMQQYMRITDVPYDVMQTTELAADLAKKHAESIATLEQIALIGLFVLIGLIVICISSYAHARIDMSTRLKLSGLADEVKALREAMENDQDEEDQHNAS